MPANEDLFAIIRAWVAANYPGQMPVKLAIHLDRSGKVSMPVPLGEPAAPAPEPAPVPVRTSPASNFRASADYREISWYGRRFHFTKTQAAVVEYLWLAQQQGTPDVDQAVLLEECGSEATRLSDLFRRGDGARAWNTLIVPGDIPGTYRLASAPSSPSESPD